MSSGRFLLLVLLVVVTRRREGKADQPQIALCLVCSLPSARVVRGACK
jgi:hypothetical protein